MIIKLGIMLSHNVIRTITRALAIAITTNMVVVNNIELNL